MEKVKERTLTIVMKDGTVHNFFFPSKEARDEARKLLENLIREKKGAMYS